MSDTKARLMEQMKDAMKTGQKERLSVIRMLITEIRNAEINDLKEPGRVRIEEEAQALVTAYHKNLTKTMAEYPENRREPLREELKIVEEFMPKQLTADELRAEVQAELNATSERNFGALMKTVGQKFKGRADGKLVADTIKSLLS